MKRVVLFLLINIAVMLVLSISARILGIDRFLTSNGLNMGMLLAFAALIAALYLKSCSVSWPASWSCTFRANLL